MLSVSQRSALRTFVIVFPLIFHGAWLRTATAQVYTPPPPSVNPFPPNPYPYDPFRNPDEPTGKYFFTVKLLGDSVVEGRNRMDAGLPQTLGFKMKDKTTKYISPAMTSAIQCRLQDGRIIPGVPAGDSCWLFRVMSGAVNAYSYLPEPKNDYIIAIQKGGVGNPIVRLTRQNLQELIADDPRALKILERGNSYEAIRIYNQRKQKK